MSRRTIHDQAPMRVYWEITGACDLACRHCRAEARPERDPRELSTEEGRRLFEQLAAFGAPLPHVVLTGGDPLKREDLFELIAIARGLGFGVSAAPSATPLLTRDAVHRLRAAGVDAISLSLDGANAERHDAIRGIPGTFERTMAAAAAAREAGLPFQVNTLVCEETAADLPAIHDRVVAMGAARWSLFFLVTVGRGSVLQPVSQAKAEEILRWVAALAAQRTAKPGRGALVITTTEAPQLRRAVAEQKMAAHLEAPQLRRVVAEQKEAAPAAQARRAVAEQKMAAPTEAPQLRRVVTEQNEAAHAASEAASRPAGAAMGGPPGGRGGAHHGAGIRDGNGILFISNTGDICPSGFLEIPAGNVRKDDVVAVYRDAPMFRALRDPDHFGGRCGRCEHRFPCGGSRARAFSATGDPLAEDPLCPHEPAPPGGHPLPA